MATPSRVTVQTSVRFPEPLHAALKELADLKYTSLNNEIVAACREYVANQTTRGK